MKKLILAAILLLAGAVNAFAQSTTVSGTVTDSGSQAWANGTYQFQFVPNPQFPTGPYTWTGGTLNQVISGSLNGSGAYSQSVPSNSAISPQGSKWILQATPNASSSSFSTSATTITGGTQTLNSTPPAISISAIAASYAYTDAEIVGPKTGSTYFNVTTGNLRGWNGSAWINIGGAGSGTVTGSGTAGFIPKWSTATALANSLCDEAITTAGTLTCTDTAGLATVSTQTGTNPPSIAASTAGFHAFTEGNCPAGASSVDILCAKSGGATINNNAVGDLVLSRTLCLNVTPITVAANVTSDQLLQACSIPANALNVVGHAIKVTTAGVFSTAAASTASLTFKIKLCTVSGCGSGTVISPLSATTGATAALTATNLQFLETGYIVTQTSGASSAYEAQGNLSIDISATATVSEALYPAVNTATVGTIDATGGLFIQITAAASAGSTSNSFTGRQLIVELVN